MRTCDALKVLDALELTTSLFNKATFKCNLKGFYQSQCILSIPKLYFFYFFRDAKMSAFVTRSGRVTGLMTRHFYTGPARAGEAMNQPVPWNYLWKPGPYPETESAKMAAAKKYGLIIEDYKPYPKGSDVMAGDYPDLPLVPEFNRSRLYEWDYPEFRR